MKKHIYSTLFLMFIGIRVWGQSPNWTVNENDYEHTMSFVAFLNVNGNNLSSINDKVAAFVNGECRGITNLSYNSAKDAYYAYLTVFANESGENITFKMYDAASDIIVDAVQTQTFEIDQHYGNVFQAYSISNPALNTDAEILNISFANATITSKTISEGRVELIVDQHIDISALETTLHLSGGAEAFLESEEVISNGRILDFSNPITLLVRSEDQSLVKKWVITITQSSGAVTYYKKNAVCYNGGAIKVLFSSDNEEVTLFKNDSFLATQVITNGETVFRDLTPGTYKVTVAGNSKEIEIIQKQ
ncbi:hypothetical protein [Tenacibaculum amylolyticum]|uniref:hypothetical protein n=1 Tax=Tenacibaculum amylolyticum TaxID=104269 RepID=UPI0038938C54